MPGILNSREGGRDSPSEVSQEELGKAYPARTTETTHRLQLLLNERMYRKGGSRYR
jgi:hypothetical protein